MPVLNQNSDWQCGNCGEMVDGDFEKCWHCGTSLKGEADPSFRSVVELRPDELQCAQCGYSLRGLRGSTCPECGKWFEREVYCTVRPPGMVWDKLTAGRCRRYVWCWVLSWLLFIVALIVHNAVKTRMDYWSGVTQLICAALLLAGLTSPIAWICTVYRASNSATTPRSNIRPSESPQRE